MMINPFNGLRRHADDEGRERTQRGVLGGLQRPGKHVYGGTVTEKVAKRRIAANKVARKSRRINRGKR